MNTSKIFDPEGFWREVREIVGGLVYIGFLGAIAVGAWSFLHDFAARLSGKSVQYVLLCSRETGVWGNHLPGLIRIEYKLSFENQFVMSNATLKEGNVKNDEWCNIYDQDNWHCTKMTWIGSMGMWNGLP